MNSELEFGIRKYCGVPELFNADGNDGMARAATGLPPREVRTGTAVRSFGI